MLIFLNMQFAFSVRLERSKRSETMVTDNFYLGLRNRKRDNCDLIMKIKCD